MNRYSKYFLQHSLWLDDGFCQYYVQDRTWGIEDILDVESVIFDWAADAHKWIAQCRDYDEATTQRRLRSYLANYCLEPFKLHRMNDHQVMHVAAGQLCRHVQPVVIHPRMGWAVQVDEHSATPVLPISVEPEPELDGLIAELKGDLDALVAEQQKKYDQYETELAKLSPEQRALLYGQKGGGAVYDSVIGGTWDMIKAAPGAIWNAAKAFPGFYAGSLKSLWKVAQMPSHMAAQTAQAIVTGNYNPLRKEINQIVTPVAQTYEQALKYKSMLTLLFGDQETYTLLYDFAQRYWAATHPIERTQMACSAASDIVVTVILAIVTAGIGAAANVASKSGRLVKVAKLLEKIALTIKKISPDTKLLNKANKVRKTEKRAAKTARKARQIEAEVKTAKRSEKLEKGAQKEYDAAKKIDGPKTTTKTKKKDDSVLNSGGDRLSESMGPAHLNDTDEYNAIIKDLEENGVDISYRKNALAYGPSSSPGKPGSIVLDPDASISAVRHEYGHFVDDKALGFPPVREYYENPRLRIVSERRQYLQEIRTARKIGDNKARRALIQDYLEEKKYIIDNFYETPYGR